MTGQLRLISPPGLLIGERLPKTAMLATPRSLSSAFYLEVVVH